MSECFLVDQSSIWERGGRCIVGLHLLQIGRCHQELLNFHYLEVRGEELGFIDSLELEKIMNRRLWDGRRSYVRRRVSWVYFLLVAGVLSFFLYVALFCPRSDIPERPYVAKGDERWSHSTPNQTLEMLALYSADRQLSDQMTMAKALVVIAKENGNFNLAWELSAQIRACQLLLSAAAVQGTPVPDKVATPVIKELSALIAQARELHYDIATMIMKMKAQIQALEERANAAAVQSTVFGQLAAEAVPKSLHCLGMRLTMEWAMEPTLHRKVHLIRRSRRLTDNTLYHFCIFSDNVLATSVVVNSTVCSAKDPHELVFHIVTDHMNYGAMQTWFLINNFRQATIEVQNIDDYAWLSSSYAPVLKQLEDVEIRKYYFKGASQDAKGTPKLRNPKYLSMLNHLRFYIPEVFPSLNKVVFLDDDVVVQQDLTELFDIDLQGNVNGAVETCLGSFHRFHKYLNFSHPMLKSSFDPESCGWAFGMNVFDLIAWKTANVTSRYHYWQEQNVDRTLWKLGTLPPGLLTFYGLVKPLDRRWHVLGLGYDPNIDSKVIEQGAVVHFNGNMKPWLKLAMSRYKPLWECYVNYTQPYVQQCNIH